VSYLLTRLSLVVLILILSSRDIEKFTGLRQPEVSIAMRKLRERDWINEREIKHEGKGTPMKIHKLGATMDQIVKRRRRTPMQASGHARRRRWFS